MTRRIPRFLASAVLGLLILEMVARVVTHGGTPTIRWYDATTQLKIEQMDALGPVDVVFAGTSMAQQGFLPGSFSDVTGLTSYNAALAGGTPEVMERWLFEEVLPRLQPSTLVWGVSSLDLAPAYGPQNRLTYDEALNTRPGGLGAIERALAGPSVLIQERASLRSVGALWGDEANERQRTLDEAERFLGPSGERRDYRLERGVDRYEVMQGRLLGFQSSVDDERLMASVIRRLTDEGITVVLVELPLPKETVSLHPDGVRDYASVGPRIAGLADESGVRLLDLSGGFAADDFVDLTHLSSDGATSLTEQLTAAWSTARNDAAPLPADFVASPTVSPDCLFRTVEDEYGDDTVFCVPLRPGA